MDKQVFGQLTQAWKLFYKGKHKDAAKQAGLLSKLSDKRYDWIKAEAIHVRARCSWARGKKTGMAKARRLWKQLEKYSTLNSVPTRLKIVQALELESSGKPNDLKNGLAILERILSDPRVNAATPEAGIDLARLYVKAGRFDDAEKTLKFIIKLLGHTSSLRRMELPNSGMVKPYMVAAKAALARLKYERDAGRAEFEVAERLRKANKFADAILAYKAIIKNFPGSDYNPRSDLHIGDCLLGLGRAARAIEHWKQFIASLPAGPWRGQAYVKLIDYNLEDQLNLPEAGRYVLVARGSLSVAMTDDKASESWKTVAFDIHLRAGLVNFCEGKAAAAVESFEAAKTLANKKTAASLDALIAAARSGQSVIPKDAMSSTSATLTSPPDKPALALSMGVIYLMVKRYANADAFFARVLGTPAKRGTPRRRVRPPLSGATSAQLAFAKFGKGAVLQARRKLVVAKAQFLESLKTFKKGSWHDESLYRIAMIIQSKAKSKFAKSIPASAKSGRRPTAAKGEAVAKAKKEYLAARAKALPYWQELIARYPKSPRCEQATYNAGVLLYEQAEAAPAARSEEMFKAATSVLKQFCDAYPKSSWAGDAYMRQIDVALEKMFDLELATALSPHAFQWAKIAANSPSRTGNVSGNSPWCIPSRRIDPKFLKMSIYNAYLRSGIVSYLCRNTAEAKKRFAAAKAFAPPHSFTVVSGTIPKGIERLTAIAEANLFLTPDEAISDKHKKASLVLQLADLYDVADDFDRELGLCNLILNGNITSTRKQLSWAFFRKGRSRFQMDWDHRDPIAAKKDYLKSLKTAPEAPWAHRALLLAANVVYNTEHNIEEAVVLWRQLLKEYPKCKDAHRASYYIGVVYELTKQTKKARAAYEDFLRDYPESPFGELVRRDHMRELDKQDKERKDKQDKERKDKQDNRK